MELGGETKMNAADIVQFYELEKSEFERGVDKYENI